VLAEAAPASRARKLASSLMVLIKGAGKTTVVFLSTLDQALKVRKSQGERVGHHDV
jgi:hypothetical protein